ncbi:hypothetical protein BGX24_010356, partial [Mortierella sp. AD032]
MFKEYKEFCDSTLACNISFRAFLTALDDRREKHQVIGFWTGTILPYLEKHNAADKRQRAAFLKKTTKKTLEDIVDEEFEIRDHIKALMPNVSQQEQAVSSLHTTRVINHVAAIQTQQRQPAGPSTRPSTGPSTGPSTTPPGSTPPTEAEQTAPVTEPTVPSTEEPVLDSDERETLLGSVEKASHRECEWMVDGICVACRFQDFQRACIDALVRNDIRKTQVSDAMAIIGVFAPSMPTRRMEEVFSKKLLYALAKPTVGLPDMDFDDSAMMKAVRLYIRGEKENASDVLYTLQKKDRKIRLMLETLLEYLPPKPVNSISENTFVTKYVAPIIQAFVDGDVVKSDFPNTESTTQKRQGLKADRPDIRAMAYGKEADIQKICNGDLNGLKRSWGYEDLKNAKAPVFCTLQSLNELYMLFGEDQAKVVIADIDDNLLHTVNVNPSNWTLCELRSPPGR